MTAKVHSKPIDLTDNKQKDDPQMTAPGSGCYGYNIEANRLRSFSNWPVAYINKAELARYGFYYVGPNDMVKCFFCRVEIGLWEQQDSVLQEHLRWSPYCALLKKRPTNNVPLDSNFLDQLPVPSYDTCGIQIRMHSQQENAYVADRHSTGSSSGSSDGSLSSPPSSLSPPVNDWQAAAGLPMRRPEYPNFAIEAKRLESYEEWPKFMKQKPKELSDAGFFYTGQGDRVKCFSCGGGLKDWEQDDDPWEQHTMWYGNCEYVRLMKGADYVAECQRKKEGLTATASTGGGGGVGSEMSSEPSTSGIGSVASTASSVGSGSPASTGCCTSPRPPSADGAALSEGEDDTGARRSSAISDTKICKICFVNEYNTAFLPCGHVVACAKCASSVTKCPLCQQPFMNVLRVYLS